MRKNWRPILTSAGNRFNPPEYVATEQWLSETYNLPEITGFPGLYQFERAPYFIGVAIALDDITIHEVDLSKAAQIGWTYFILGYLLKRVVKDACPMLGIFAKEKDAKAFHDEKLKPTVECNGSVNAIIDITTSRSSGNRWDFKNFPGGFLKLVGSNSPGNVKSTSSVGLVFVEEPDDTSDDVKDQGDAIGLGEERQKRYNGNKKLIVGGTPAVKGFSKTEARLEKSDKRVLPIECHCCGHKHVLDWDNVHWVGKDGDPPVDELTGEILVEKHDIFGFSQPDTAVYRCPECNEDWDDYQRQKNIIETVYKAVDSGDELAGWVKTKPFNGIAGFTRLSELYVCVPGTSLEMVVIEYLTAQHHSERGDQSLMIKFINQKLGLPYEYESDAPEAETLEERAKDYAELTVPRGGFILTAGVDVQHDRLAVVIRAWGRGEESWLVYWGELAAKVSTTDVNDPVWTELHNLLFSPIKHELGFHLNVKAVSIDCSDGQTAEQVYTWVRPRQKLGVMAAKGSSSDTGEREIFTKPKPVDLNSDTKAAKFGLSVHIVGTQKAKDLLIGDKGRITLEGSGSGRIHWYESVRADYYEQILSEVKIPSRSGKKKWEKKAGVRNEALDCEVYALHASRNMRVNRMLPSAWDALEKQLLQADLFSKPVETTQSSNSALSKSNTRVNNTRTISKGLEL